MATVNRVPVNCLKELSGKIGPAKTHNQLTTNSSQVNMADYQLPRPLQNPAPDFVAAAEAYRVLAAHNQVFADNPAIFTPDGALLFREIREMRIQMNERFDRIELRTRAEYVLHLYSFQNSSINYIVDSTQMQSLKINLSDNATA